MAKLFKKGPVRVSSQSLKEKGVYDIVLEKMQAAINTEIEDPNGKFNANDLGQLQKELYG